MMHVDDDYYNNQYLNNKINNKRLILLFIMMYGFFFVVFFYFILLLSQWTHVPIRDASGNGPWHAIGTQNRSTRIVSLNVAAQP